MNTIDETDRPQSSEEPPGNPRQSVSRRMFARPEHGLVDEGIFFRRNVGGLAPVGTGPPQTGAPPVIPGPDGC